jgi:chromosome partitioning protein
VKTVGFFNVKSGVGTTTLIYHLAWMYQELGIKTVALDLDPQAGLTAAFLSDDRLGNLASDKTILGAVKPLIESENRIREPVLEEIAPYLALLPGNLGLSLYEDRFAEAWNQCNEGNFKNALQILTSFYQVADRSAQRRDAQLVMIDVGPGIGAIHRAALLACDFVIIPLSTNLSSFQSLPALGPALRKWRSVWRDRCRDHPSGAMEPAGYVVLQHAVIRDGHTRLAEELSKLYHREVLGEPDGTFIMDSDPHRLGILKQYRGLMTLAQATRKPVFLLKPADGALGSQAEAVADCYRDYKELALRIADVCGIPRESEDE